MIWLVMLGLLVALGLLLRELTGVARRAVQVVEQREAPARLARDVRKLELLEPGGTPETAIEIAAPSVVEAHAGRTPCTQCGALVEVEEHAVEEHAQERLRVARLRCRTCGHARTLYFRLARLN
ncbi:MAG: hypothetical protein AB7K71_23590 [Polyangiaceae bacterium]